MSDVSMEAIFEDNGLIEFFKNMRTRLSKIKGADAKFMGLLSAVVFRDIQDHFTQEQGSKGPWEKWSKSYQKQMEARGRGGNKILQWSGKLRQTFKPTDYRVTNEGPVWFNDAMTKSGFPYAALHDEGGPFAPQRDFMWLSESAAESIAEQTLNFLLDEGV